MTRRIHRSQDFQVTLDIQRDSFLRPPRDAQRNWLLNRAIREFSDELAFLDTQCASFVTGSNDVSLDDRTQTSMSDDQIMEDWQIPVMESMAELVAANGGDILEIGFGRGIASGLIQSHGVRSHTIIECNDSVCDRFQEWKKQYPESDIRLLKGRWQDVIQNAKDYDGIFFHTYPLNELEFVEQVVKSVTFAAHFFPTAARHLRSGGVFTYLTNEPHALGRGHQRLLLDHFSSFTVSVLRDLQVPEQTRDAMWADSMVVVRAVK